MRQAAMHMNPGRQRAEHDGGRSPPMHSEAEMSGEIKVWLFVSVVPATFAAVIAALALLVR
jgi:hypothetical protein